MSEHSADNRKRVRAALILTAAFTLVEIAGGVLSGSLALIADAGHMLTDTLALGLALRAFRVCARPADAKRSQRHHRHQPLAAFVNGLGLIAIVVWILVEAVGRVLDAPPIAGGLMLAIAAAGLLVNVVAFLILHGGDQENLNVRGAMLHVMSDLLGSLAAITAAVVILLTGWLPIDPLLSVVVALLILRSAWDLIMRSAHILLEGTPEWLDVDRMQAKLVESVPEIEGIHHVHVWGLTPQRLMLTMHVSVCERRDDADPDRVATRTVRRIKRLLQTEFGIVHSTIEVESGACADQQEPPPVSQSVR
jgi:cobalt-zinc-cadmium efflux system protein